uniref:Centrosomal protein of 162 kDa n=1 Tax=Lygus hesperus TaxID=30085 RepID=A0A0K8TB02_LYGHE
MSCCFTFYPFIPMDTKSDAQSSVAEYLEKEKLCQEICETISKSVQGLQPQGNCALPMEASCLLPEFNSDEDVEDILQQISDLLGSQLGDTSEYTDIEGVEDLSVDEILKQAEQIVRASTPYFERKAYKNCTGVETLLEPISKSVKQLGRCYSKPISHNQSSYQHVNRNTRTEVSESQFAVKNTNIFDRNGNSPTLSNDSDDKVFESPVVSPGPETPRRNDPSNLRKSCSDSDCHLKVVQEVKKSSSAETCDIGNQCVDYLRRKTEIPDGYQHSGEVLERVKELTLSDLRVLPYFSSKETISPGETNTNIVNVIEEPNVLNENINLVPASGGDDDHIICQIDNEASSNPVVENTGNELRENCTVSKEREGVDVPKESTKVEPVKSSVSGDQKHTNWKPEDKNNQSLAVSKQVPLQNVKLVKKSKKFTANLNSPSKTAKDDAENVCPNEEHCTTIITLRNEIESLANQITEHEKLEERARKNETLAATERQRIKILQEEVKSQEELIEGYQRENQRLTSDVLSAKESWKATEVQLVDKVLELEKRLSLNIANSTKEKEELGGHLKQAYDLVKKLEAELERFKNEKQQLKKENDDLTVDVMRLNCELEVYNREYKKWNKNENDKIALLESNALIQSKLSQVNTDVTRKQTEIIRLNGEIGRLRGELEKIRLGSVVNQAADSTNAISQLQAALAMERDNCNEIAKERDCLNHEVRDLRKQVALLDNSGYIESGANANKIEEKMVSQSQMTAELEATRCKIELEHNKKIYVDLQNKYDRDIVELGHQIKKLQKENLSLKHLLNDQAKQQPRKQALANSKMKEDAHLLATIRGLQGELNSREKDVHRLNKELMDAKKTNRRLQQEREKALTSSTSKMRDNQEALLFLRNENRTMLEEIKRLEQDLISLHNKRIQDMSDLQEQHDRELNTMKREHASKHSSSTVAHLQGQLYTQQMVIHHLKQQIKEYEERFEELSILKAERDHFERALMTANQKIARLNELSSPENLQYASLLEKLEYLERRHEIREEKLQSIVKDLIVKQKKGACSENCRDKILNKNREICYYRGEMDKMLATLAEFRWN